MLVVGHELGKRDFAVAIPAVLAAFLGTSLWVVVRDTRFLQERSAGRAAEWAFVLGTFYLTRIAALFVVAVVGAAIQGKRAILDGMSCGLSVLDLNGRVLDWNETQRRRFAPPGAAERKRAGLPCYQVYHPVDRPCSWCKLPWKPPVDGDGRWRIDAAELEQLVEEGKNWCVSNQLDPPDSDNGPQKLRLFHIYFGLLRNGKETVGVVEAVTEVTRTVLEMPFLRENQDDESPVPGMPPISIIDCKRRVVGFNAAKRARSPRAKLGEYCYACYPDEPKTAACPSCPVEPAIARRPLTPTRGLSQHPAPAMLTCVPLAGPDGSLRAVFQYIDDVADLVALRDFADQLNKEVDPSEIPCRTGGDEAAREGQALGVPEVRARGRVCEYRGRRVRAI